MNSSGFISFHRPSIGEEEVAEVVATLRSGWLTTGPRTAQFEKDFSAYTGAALSQAVNSCTAGLHLALSALGIKRGDEVITTPLTFCATVNTILECGATPVLADIGTDGNIDPTAVAAAITPRTRALVPVHLGGLPCDMDALWQIAADHGLAVIEDAAHAVGAHYRGKQIGSPGKHGRASDAVAFSFYATKNLTTGEGGMVTTQSPDLFARMKTLCLHGISRDAWNRYADRANWFYEVVACGFKYNLSDLQSAIGIHQLRRQEQFIAERSACARAYSQAFADVPELECPPEKPDCRHAWHLYSLRLNLDRLSIGRDAFIEELRELGIGTSVHFIPIPLHPFYAQEHGLLPESVPQALSLYRRLISLPLYPALQPEEIKRVIDAVKQVVSRASTATSISVGQMVSV